MNTHEQWAPIKSFEDIFEVSDLGRVRRVKNSRVLRGSPTRDGYLLVCLRNKGADAFEYMHRLVASAFVPRANPAHTIVNHIDSNRLNNVASNLEWTDKRGNAKHAIKNTNWTPPVFRGEQHWRSVLTSTHIPVIRARFSAGEPVAQIANSLELGYGAVWGVAHGRTWTHIT